MKTLVVQGSRPLGAPKGWDQELDGHCGVLYIIDQIEVRSGDNVMYSFYRPTAEDLKALNEGGILRLGIHGRGHPVIQLGVLGPELTKRIDPDEGFDMGGVINGD